MKNSKIFLIIALVGIAVYVNSLLNGFVLDDLWQILNNTKVTAAQNIFSFFQGSTFGFLDKSAALQLFYYYKPMMVISFTLMYSIFGQNAFFFHFFQVLIHIVNVSLIFILLSKFFGKKTSLLLSLIFLVHPINSESVDYISALQDVLFSLFGLLALFFLGKNQQSKPSKKHYFLVYFLLLLSLLSKESGVLFIAIVPLYTFIFQKIKFTKYTIVSFFSFATYLYLRFVVGGVPLHKVSFIPIAEADFLTKLLTLPKSFVFYLITFLFPLNLSYSHMWIVKTADFINFYLPLLLLLTFVLTVFLIGKKIFKERKDLLKVYLFFVCWFFIGMLFHLNILPFLDSTAADRWFYFPFIGLLGIAGSYSYLFQEKLLKYKKLITFFAIFIILILSLRTFIRNFDWKDSYTLTSNDTKVDNTNFYLESNLGIELFYQKRYSDAKKAFLKSYSLFPTAFPLSNLGIIYLIQGNYPKSENYLYKALTYKTPDSYDNLAFVLIKDKKFDKAKQVIKEGLALYPQDSWLSTLSVFVDYGMGNKEKAKEDVLKVYKLYPSDMTYKMYTQLINNQPLGNLVLPK